MEIDVSGLIRTIRGPHSQDELAHRARFARATIGRWEAGDREPSLSELSRLARATGKRLDVGLTLEPELHELDLVGAQLDLGPTNRISGLAGDGWAAIRSGLSAAAEVQSRSVVIGPVGAVLRGAPRLAEHTSVDLLTDEESFESVVDGLADDARATLLYEQRTHTGRISRQLLGTRSGGVVSVATSTESGIDVAGVLNRAHTFVMNGEGIGLVRVPLVEDLLEIAEKSSWPGDALTRSGLRGVLASGRYTARKAPDPEF